MGGDWSWIFLREEQWDYRGVLVAFSVYFWGFSEALCGLLHGSFFCYDFFLVIGPGCMVTTSEVWDLVTH